MPKKGDYLKFKNSERKIKSFFMIYADSEKILVPEDNSEDFYMNKYKKEMVLAVVTIN